MAEKLSRRQNVAHISQWHFLRTCRPLEGVREWLDTLGRFNVPCALVSALDRKTVQVGSHPVARPQGHWLQLAPQPYFKADGRMQVPLHWFQHLCCIMATTKRTAVGSVGSRARLSWLVHGELQQQQLGIWMQPFCHPTARQ